MIKTLLLTAVMAVLVQTSGVFAAETETQDNSLTNAELLTLSRLNVLGTGAAAPVQGQMHLLADKAQYDRVEDLLTASGNVEIDWNGARVYSNIANYYQGTEVVSASGKVRILKDGNVLGGDKVTFQLADSTGAVENGGMFIKKNNLYLHGASIKKVGDKDYTLTDSTLTACDGDDPSWKFKVSDLKVTVDDMAYGKNATLYLSGIPVFWSPYLAFPTKTERQSGFLPPHFGQSTTKGFFIDLPYYWAAAPNMEMTITPDLQSRRGAGLGIEHHYLGYNRGQSSSRGYLIYDTQKQEFRGALALKHQVDLTPDTYWRADVNQTLDRAFYADYAQTSGEYNRQFLGTTAFLSHRSGDLLYTGGVDYMSNLDASSNSNTLQKLPYVTMHSTGSRLAKTPLYYSFAGAATNFYRDQGWRGQRVDLLPQLALPFSGSGFSGLLQGGYDQRFYSADNTTGEGSGNMQRGLVKLDGMLQSEYARIYDLSFSGITKVRHLLTPQLNYTLTQKRGQEDLPFFDYDDRIVGGQLISLSLLNTVTGRSGKDAGIEYRDLARFSVTQGYQLSGERRDLLVLVDEGRSFTDTRFLVELLPLKKWRFFTDTRVSPYSGDVTNSSVGVEAARDSGTSINLNYSYAQGQLQYLNGQAIYTDFKPFTLGFTGRYSFDQPGFLEKNYLLVYTQQCWSITFAYQERPAAKTFNFSFTLLGLGSYKVL